LPNMLAVDVAVTRIGSVQRSSTLTSARVWLKPAAGAVIVVFGLSGLAHAARMAGADHPSVEALASICHH